MESAPGAIMGPIAQLFGYIINFLFNIVYFLGPANSLGIAIVLMTIIFHFLVLPLHLKSQKSMLKMRELKPELDKIKEKYAKYGKDPEMMKKSQQEQSALLAKHGANPLSGCLPILIQMPLFIGLNIVMRQAALYITALRDLYTELAEKLLEIPSLLGVHGERGILWKLAEGEIGERIIPLEMSVQSEAFRAFQHQHVLANGMEIEPFREALTQYAGDVVVLDLPEHLARVINRFNPADWEMVYEQIPAESLGLIQGLVENLTQIQTFLGISIVVPSGWALPGILIPIITGVSMFISSWLMQQKTYDPNADERTVMTQKMTLFVMPVMMAFFTVQMVAAVGVFWTTGQLFRITQDLLALKKSGTPLQLPFAKPPPEVVDIVTSKKKK